MENKTERIMRSLFIRILGWIINHLFNLQKWIHLKNNESDQNWDCGKLIFLFLLLL